MLHIEDYKITFISDISAFIFINIVIASLLNLQSAKCSNVYNEAPNKSVENKVKNSLLA